MRSNARRLLFLALVSGTCIVLLAAYRVVVNDSLNTAAEHGNLPLVQALLARGANVDGRSIHFLTPLMSAAKGGQTSVARFLTDKGADVNAHNGSGSPLMWAAASGNKPTVRLLLERGANVNWRSDAGTTALQMAKEYQHPQIVIILKQAGARR